MTNEELIEDLKLIEFKLDYRDKSVGLQVAAMIQHNRILSEKNAIGNQLSNIEELMQEWATVLKGFLPPQIPLMEIPKDFPPVVEGDTKEGDTGPQIENPLEKVGNTPLTEEDTKVGDTGSQTENPLEKEGSTPPLDEGNPPQTEGDAKGNDTPPGDDRDLEKKKKNFKRGGK